MNVKRNGLWRLKKGDRAHLRTKLAAWCHDRGAQQVTEYPKKEDPEVGPDMECTFETEAGTLHVSLYEGWMACRFADSVKARRLGIDCSSVGKYNAHPALTPTTTWQEAAGFYVAHLTKAFLLPK